jgi:hypothetical protein
VEALDALSMLDPQLTALLFKVWMSATAWLAVALLWPTVHPSGLAHACGPGLHRLTGRGCPKVLQHDIFEISHAAGQLP